MVLLKITKALKTRQFKNLATTFLRVLKTPQAKAFGKEVKVLVDGLKRHAKQHVKVTDWPKKKAVPWREEDELLV